MSRAISSINDKELQLSVSDNSSWHTQYKDSAYIYVGGLQPELTEGDVITIFSQYGEVMDVNLPRDKTTGKTRGFGFLMYEDQRSTILAVDNLNGAKVLDRVLRVDHVANYKQKEFVDGEWRDREEQSLNAKPTLVKDAESGSNSSESEPDLPEIDLKAPNAKELLEKRAYLLAKRRIDPEDPMSALVAAQRKDEKRKKKKDKSRSKHANETPDEREARKARKRAKKLAGAGHADHDKKERSRGEGSSKRPRSRSPPPRGLDHREQRRDDGNDYSRATSGRH